MKGTSSSECTAPLSVGLTGPPTRKGDVEDGFVYDLTIDPEAENNTHAFVLDMIGYSKRVLEVGCATGYLTKVLTQRGCTVTGIEIDAGAAEKASRWADKVITGNAEDLGIWAGIDDEAYDVITFGDVLEHLYDPLTVLRTARRKLKPTGFVVTSLPNIAHGDVRLSLLHGAFQYRTIGLLDRTHVRFFTLRSVRELLLDAGFIVVETRRVIMPMFTTELGLQREDYSETVLAEVRADSEYETYQFVMKSVLDTGSQTVTDMAHKVEELSDEVHDLQLRNRRLEEDLVGNREMRAEYERISGQMHEFTDHIEDLTRQVYKLHDELGIAEQQRVELVEANAALRASLDEAGADRVRLQQSYDEILRSWPYRILAPFRRGRSSPRGANQA